MLLFRIQLLCFVTVVFRSISALLFVQIPCVSMSCADYSRAFYSDDELAPTTLCGPLPKCRILLCDGSASNRVSALAVPDIVDIVQVFL